MVLVSLDTETPFWDKGWLMTHLGEMTGRFSGLSSFLFVARV